jgi:hypothetical protein
LFRNRRNLARPASDHLRERAGWQKRVGSLWLNRGFAQRQILGVSLQPTTNRAKHGSRLRWFDRTKPAPEER